MTKLRIWVGLSALLLSLQVCASDITVQDAWIRPLTPGQEEAIVGMVINSARPARIVGAISSAYMAGALQGPGKSGTNKSQQIGFIELPAQKSVVLSAESAHLMLSGNRQIYSTTDKVTVFVTVEFEDKTSKTVSVLAQPVGNNVAAGAVVVPATVPRNPVEATSKVEAKPAAPVEAPKPVAAPKPPVAEKPAKAAPVAAPKSAPAPVAVSVPPPPAPVAPVVVPAPVVVAAPVVEPKKAPEVKPAEPVKQEEPKVNVDCLNMADELRGCDQSNDRVLEWCETSIKARHTCPLSLEQVKKLRK